MVNPEEPGPVNYWYFYVARNKLRVYISKQDAANERNDQETLSE